MVRALIHALEERAEVLGALGDVDTDQRRAGRAVVLLHVVEHDDVLPVGEHIVEEVAKGTRLLQGR